jgi:hypothetical protein
MRRSIAGDILGYPDEDRINVKEKGNRNELRCAKAIAQWTQQEFQRVPRSGGLRWKDTQRIVGDVVGPVDFKFPFVIETKHYKKVEIKSLLRANSVIYTLWDQVRGDGERAGKIPMLWLRVNNQAEGTWTVFMESHIYKCIPDHDGMIICQGLRYVAGS